MIRSLFASASGLVAHQKALDVVGNNLANVNTTGYKAQRLRFSTLFSETLRGASAPADDFGGRNPVQLGHGVKVAAVDTILAQGVLEDSESPLNVALQNDGFFVVNRGSELLFTRDGAFSVDASNMLVNSATGARVQRIGDVGAVPTDTAPVFQTQGQNIIIPIGETIAGKETTRVAFAGNLDGQAGGPLADVLTTSQPFTTSGGSAATINDLLNSLDQTTSVYAAGNGILITGTAANGAEIRAMYQTTGVATPGVNEEQRLALGGPTAGTFTLSFGGETTGLLASNASAAEIEAALEGLNSIGSGNVNVVASGSDFDITFQGKLAARDVTALVGDFTALTGGGAASVMETTAGSAGQDTVGNLLTTINAAFGGAAADESQRLSLGGATAGTFSLSFGGQTAAGLNFNDSAATIQTALEGLSTIGAGNVGVTQVGSAFEVTFEGMLSGINVAQLGLDATGLTLTAGNAASVSTTVTGGTGSPNGATATLDGNGNIVLTANRQAESALSISLASDPANVGGGTTNFTSFVKTTDGRDGETASTAITVFDTQGASHTLTFTFQKQAANEWDLVSAIDPSGTFVGFDNRVDGITFNENGSLGTIKSANAREVLATSVSLTASTGGTTVAASGATALGDLDQTTAGYTAGDVRIVGTRADGTLVDTRYSLETGSTVDGTTDVNALLAAINTAFGSGTTGGATATLVNGNIVLTADASGPAELSLTLASVPGDGVTNFDAFTQITDGTEGDTDVRFEINNLVQFGTPQDAVMEIGMADAFDGLTQFGGFETLAAVEQNGFAPGTLLDVAVEGNGIITGNFDNGRTEALAQLAIATFRNPHGLTRMSDTNFRANVNSGIAEIGTAQTGGAGTVVGGTLETSNVDIGIELTRLIIAQRGFQVNARAFVTSDQVLEETANLKR